MYKVRPAILARQRDKLEPNMPEILLTLSLAWDNQPWIHTSLNVSHKFQRVFCGHSHQIYYNCKILSFGHISLSFNTLKSAIRL